MKKSPVFASPSPRKRSRSDNSDVVSSNSPKFLLPIKRFKLDAPIVKVQTFTPTVAKQSTPVFALAAKRFHSDIPVVTGVVKKTRTTKRKKTTEDMHLTPPVATVSVNAVFSDIMQHHLKIRTLVSPRDILLFLATDDRFRLLPKLLHILDCMLDRIEHIYRTDLSAGVSLLLPGTKIRMKVTPSVATKLVALYKLFRRTDQCLRAYVLRSIKTSRGSSETSSSKSSQCKKLN